jgi:hypothetical protein
MNDKQAPGGVGGGCPASTADVRSASGSFGGNGMEGAPNGGTGNKKK